MGGDSSQGARFYPDEIPEFSSHSKLPLVNLVVYLLKLAQKGPRLLELVSLSQLTKKRIVIYMNFFQDYLLIKEQATTRLPDICVQKSCQQGGGARSKRSDIYLLTTSSCN